MQISTVPAIVFHLYHLPRYLQYLLEYMESYVHRIKPLLDIQQEMESVKTEFDQQFSEGYFPGWPVCLVVIDLGPVMKN